MKAYALLMVRLLNSCPFPSQFFCTCGMLALNRLRSPLPRSQWQNRGPTEMSRIDLFIFALVLRKSKLHHKYLQGIVMSCTRNVSFKKYHITRDTVER